MKQTYSLNTVTVFLSSWLQLTCAEGQEVLVDQVWHRSMHEYRLTELQTQHHFEITTNGKFDSRLPQCT